MKYITGQILVEKKSDFERKVLGVCDLVVFMSTYEDFNKFYDYVFTEKELDKYYTIKEEKFVPKGGERYWFVCDSGKVEWSGWGNFRYDKFRLSQGNVFRTREEAEAKLKELMK